MATRREFGLKKGVGLRALASIIFVNLAMAIFVSLGVVADEALGLTPLVFIIVGVVFLLTLLGYVEGIAMLPQAGGAAGFVRRGLGELTSFFVGWALILDYLIIVVLTAYFATHYLGSIPTFKFLLYSPTDTVVTAMLILGAALVTIRGTRSGARTKIWVASIALVSQVGLAILGIVILGAPKLSTLSIEFGITPSWHGFLFALPIAMIGFTGLDSVANLGAEIRSPGRYIPRPLAWSSVTSVIMFVLMSVVALNAQPVLGQGITAETALGKSGGWLDRPVIGIISGLNLSQASDTFLRTVIGGLAACVLLLAASSALSGLGRIAWFMSSSRQAPSILFSVDKKRSVPQKAILLLSIVAILILLITVSISESAVVLAQVYAFGATFATSLAVLSIIRLRWIEPDLPRPFRAPGNVTIKGRSLSIPVIIGFICVTVMWLLVMSTHDAARAVGLVWMVTGFVAYATYRLAHGLPVARRADSREDKTLFKVDMRSYRKLLIAARPDASKGRKDLDAELIALADKIADDLSDDDDLSKGKRLDVAIMLVHELPLAEPLDADIGDVEKQTTHRLSSMRASSEKLGMHVSSTIVRARAAGRSICQEARRREVDAVLMATQIKQRHADVVFGRTVSYVLRHAPCDVIVLSLPDEKHINKTE